MIIIENKTKASKLCLKDLRFERAPKVVEKHQKVKISLVYITCLYIGYN